MFLLVLLVEHARICSLCLTGAPPLPQLESEVVALQQDQAQAAAKLQVSHEDLLQARAQLLAVKDGLESSSIHSSAAAAAMDEVRHGPWLL